MATLGKDFVSQVCNGLPGNIEPMVRELAENVVFVRSKLVKTRKSLEKEAVVVPYDNGGGQTGIRKNPGFEMYNSLLAQYRKSIDQLIGILRKYSNYESKPSDSNPLAEILAEAEKVLADGS